MHHPRVALDPFSFDIRFGLSVRHHIPLLNGDYGVIMYYQNDKIQFKQSILFMDRKVIE
jgi:hypothetical protein